MLVTYYKYCCLLQLFSVLPLDRFIVLRQVQQAQELLTKHQQSTSTFVWWGARFLLNRKLIYSGDRTWDLSQVSVLTTELRRLNNACYDAEEEKKTMRMSRRSSVVKTRTCCSTWQKLYHDGSQKATKLDLKKKVVSIKDRNNILL